MGDEILGDAIALLRHRLSELHAEANELTLRHLDFAMAENKKKAWAQKSVLFVQVRLRDNSLAVTWHEVHWYGSKAAKTRRMTKRVITKPKNNYGYSANVLLKIAQAWEADLVVEIEQALFPLRREAFFIGKAIGQLNHIHRRSNDEK